VALHRKHPVNKYAWDLLELFAPQWKRGEIDRLRSVRSGSITRSNPSHQSES